MQSAATTPTTAWPERPGVSITRIDTAAGYLVRFSPAPCLQTGHVLAVVLVLLSLAEVLALQGVMAAHLQGAPWDQAAVDAAREAFSRLQPQAQPAAPPPAPAAQAGGAMAGVSQDTQAQLAKNNASLLADLRARGIL